MVGVVVGGANVRIPAMDWLGSLPRTYSNYLYSV